MVRPPGGCRQVSAAADSAAGHGVDLQCTAGAGQSWEAHYIYWRISIFPKNEKQFSTFAHRSAASAGGAELYRSVPRIALAVDQYVPRVPGT